MEKTNRRGGEEVVASTSPLTKGKEEERPMFKYLWPVRQRAPINLPLQIKHSIAAPNSPMHKWDVLQTWILTACMRALMLPA